MAIELYWYNESHTILMIHYPEQWTWEEYADTFFQAKALMENEAHGVYVIHYSDTGFKALPTGVALPHMKRVSEHRARNLLISFLVIEAELSRNFIDMMLKVLPANRARQPNVFVSSVDEALTRIAQTPSG